MSPLISVLCRFFRCKPHKINPIILKDSLVLTTESLYEDIKIQFFFFMLASFTDEDYEKLEKIINSVLIPTKDREERKARVNKYLQWVRELCYSYVCMCSIFTLFV